MYGSNSFRMTPALWVEAFPPKLSQMDLAALEGIALVEPKPEHQVNLNFLQMIRFEDYVETSSCQKHGNRLGGRKIDSGALAETSSRSRVYPKEMIQPATERESLAKKSIM